MMASLGASVHPNVLAALMSPNARRLATNREAARERKAAIRALKAAGVSAKGIGLTFGVSRTRIYQLLA